MWDECAKGSSKNYADQILVFLYQNSLYYIVMNSILQDTRAYVEKHGVWKYLIIIFVDAPVADKKLK